MLGRNSVKLAPAYDLVSTTVYDGEYGAALSRQMGMRVGEHGNIDRITSNDFLALGKILGYRSRVFRVLVQNVCDAVDGCFDSVVHDAAHETGLDTEELAARIWNGVEQRRLVLQGV